MSRKKILYLLAPLFLFGVLGAWITRTPVSVKGQSAINEPIALEKNSIGAEASQTDQTKVATNALVTRVVDGDTLEVRLDAEPDRDFKIRLLGVNTPETVDPRRSVQCFGEQASKYTKQALTDKRIRLEADPQADERDKYDRLLRNVILDDGTDFNAKLVEDGYAQAYLGFPLNPARKTLLRQLERQAKEAGRGLWTPGACP